MTFPFKSLAKIVLFLELLICAGLASSCTIKRTARPKMIVPDNYSGYLAVLWNCPNGTPLQFIKGPDNKDIAIMEFNEQGIFCTSSSSIKFQDYRPGITHQYRNGTKLLNGMMNSVPPNANALYWRGTTREDISTNPGRYMITYHVFYVGKDADINNPKINREKINNIIPTYFPDRNEVTRTENE